MRALGVALLAALIAWLIAQLALDHFLVAQGQHEIARVARGESRISFEFEQSRDLISGSVEGVDVLEWSNGEMRGHLPAGGANLRLNLRGLQLDGRRFDRLLARIEASAPATLTLIFDEPGQLLQMKRDIQLAAGWNLIDLALDDAAWTPNAGGPQRTRWGGTSGLVGEFRLYLGGPQPLHFALDYLRFAAATAPTTTTTTAVEWIGAAEARARIASGSLQRGAAQARMGVLLPLGMDTPERMLALRDSVRAIDAESLFWPSWRALPGPAQAADVAPPSGWAPGWAAVIIYTLAAGLLRWRARRLSPRLAAALELSIGHAPLLMLSLGLGLAEQPAPTTLALMAAVLAFQVSGVRASGTSFAGSAPAWNSGLRFTAIAATGLATIALLSGHWLLPGSQRLLLYIPFVALQQALLLGFLWPRAGTLTTKHAQPLTAVLFAIAHAPNFALMCLSLLAAWGWLGLYQRHRAWLPVLASHYVLGVLAITALPPDILYSAEVGLRYFQVQ
jgi:hypothetical protein